MPCWLAIETSTDACSVAVGHARESVVRTVTSPGAHAGILMSMIDDALQAADRSLQTLDGVVYGRGPGSFTGVRIAVALAQGLAEGAGLPMLGVSSLRALAQHAMDRNPDTEVLVLQDARMNELYAGRFRRDDGIATAVEAEALVAPEALQASERELAIGGALTRLPSLAQRLKTAGVRLAPEFATPDAAALLVIAPAAPASDWHAPAQAAASYLRQQVASPKSP